MPSLLSLPREVRNIIYDFYLDGIQLEVGKDVNSCAYVRIVRPGLPHAVSLALVNRQLHQELGDLRKSCKRLVLCDRLHTWKEFKSLVSRSVLGQITHLHTKINGRYIQDIGPLTVDDLPSLEHITWSPSITTGLSLWDHLGEQQDSLEHSKCWTDKTATEVVALIEGADPDGDDDELDMVLTAWVDDHEESLSKRLRKAHIVYDSLEILVGIVPLWEDGQCAWHSCMWVSADFSALFSSPAFNGSRTGVCGSSRDGGRR